MPSRPHFARSTPPGFRDETARYPFDWRQIAPTAASEPDSDPPFTAASPLPVSFTLGGSPIANLFLRLDLDAPFLWRGVSWECPIFTQLQAFLDGNIAIRVRDPWGNYLSNDFIPILNWAQGYYVWQPWLQSGALTGPLWVAPSAGGMGVAFADEIYCPAGSTVAIDLINLQPNNPESQLSLNNIGRLLARGVKRRPLGECQ